MYIHWRGAGILVVFVTLGMMGLAQALFPAGYKNYGWPLGAAFMASGAFLLPLGILLNRPRRQTVVDPETGQPVTVLVTGPRHVLYELRMEVWSVSLLLGGLVFVLK